MHVVDADDARDGKQQRREQHQRRDALQHRAQDNECDDRDGEEAGFATRHVGHCGGQVARKPGLRERPRHRGGGPDDEQDGAGQRCGIDQHRIEPAPVELPIDEEPADHRVDDTDGGDFRGGRDALDDRGANDEWQQQSRQRDDQGSSDLRCGRPLKSRHVLMAGPNARDHAERERKDQGRQQPAGEQSRDRDIGDRSDGDQDEARRDRLGHRG